MEQRLTRREILQQASLIGVGLTAGAVPGWSLPVSWLAQAHEIVPFTDIPDTFARRRTGMDLRELRAWKTPIEDFFAVSHYGVPEVDASTWTLETRGLVSTPITLSIDQIRRRPRVERTVTFECSGNQARAVHRLIGNTTWAGASLTALLRETGPTPAAKEVIFWCADTGTETIRDNEYEQNFSRSMSLADAMDADAVLAYEMDGQPLPVDHGAPLRLVVPGWYGIANVKWLTQIEVSADRLMNRFMGRDYVTIKGREVDGRTEWVETSVTQQRIKSVIARVTKNGGQFTLFGAAWSNGKGVRRVEVKVDDGGWRPATLESHDNPYAWTFWTLNIDALPAGEHTLVSRATDAEGNVQPENLDLKRTYWEDNAQWTRTIMVT